jgi:hypothetical protein
LIKIATFLLLAGVMQAQVYYAKVEPLFKYTVAAAVAGQVVLADENEEGKVSSKTIIQLDDALDRINYEVAKENHKNLGETYETKRAIYEKIAAMSTKSQIEKDTEKIALLAARNAQESARYQMEAIRDMIGKKRVDAKGLYVYTIAVNEKEYVAPGTRLAELHDTSGSRLVIFVTKEEIDTLTDDAIAVNGQTGLYRIDKKWRITDAEFISGYRVELTGPAPETFSEVVKIEILTNQQDNQ